MMRHLDEETLHAFIDGELLPIEEARLEHHVAHCAPCAAALAEARGLVAAASRVVSALDEAPTSASQGPVAAVASVADGTAMAEVKPLAAARPRRSFASSPYLRVAAVLLVAAGSVVALDRARPGSPKALARSDSPAAESNALASAPSADQATSTNVTGAAAPSEENTLVAQRAPAAAPVAAVGSTDAAAGFAAPASTGATRRARNEVPERTAARIQPSAGAPAGVPEQAEVATGNKQTPPPAVMPTSPSTPPVVPLSASRDMAASDARAANTSAPEAVREPAAAGPRVTRYRLQNGVVLTLVDEPLDMSQTAPRALTSRRSAPAAAVAQGAGTSTLNTFRWSNAETKRTYLLTGPVSEDVLRAAASRLGELHRIP